MTKHLRLCLALASVLSAGRASAGILDSPLPMLGGVQSAHLYSVTGVVSAAGLATFFSCTNPSSSTVSFSVQVFVDGGGDPCNDAAAAAVSIPPGGTKLLSTQNNVQSSFFDSSPIGATDMFITIGSARIVSTAKDLLCTVFVADVYNSPPMTMMRLNAGKKGKMKGD